MHIMEGFLPLGHALAWTGASLPFWAMGIYALRKQIKKHPETKLLLGAMGGFAFMLSALKIPSVSGSCSHPTGIGLGTVLFGPGIMTVLGSMVLLFQALFLAHGGLSTLGANIFSMCVVGTWVASAVFWILRKFNLPLGLAIFGAAFVSDLSTYLCTATQLALAFPDTVGGFTGAWIKFSSIFAISQIPLALIEASLSVLLIKALRSQAPAEMLTPFKVFEGNKS